MNAKIKVSVSRGSIGMTTFKVDNRQTDRQDKTNMLKSCLRCQKFRIIFGHNTFYVMQCFSVKYVLQL